MAPGGSKAVEQIQLERIITILKQSSGTIRKSCVRGQKSAKLLPMEVKDCGM